jgi:DNA-directed RNA polymerase subunit alpha
MLSFECRVPHRARPGLCAARSAQKGARDIGEISVDAIFSPIRRVNYEVENMRVGDRTDFNRLRISIETDGTITPRAALEQSIEIMITQLKAIVGFREEEIAEAPAAAADGSGASTPRTQPRS